MARVKLHIPGEEIFSTKISLRITDINYGNHLGNDALVGLLQETRVRWLLSLGLGELDVGGCGLIMADLAVEYKLEGFYNDQLSITLFVGDITAAGFELYYLITNQNNNIVAKAKTGMVCYNYELKKVNSIPHPLRRYLGTESD